MARKLLLADDSLTIQKVVELVLAHENFEIKTVNDGEQALEAVETFAPDIVLADIEMPKLNGYQLCEKVKNNPAAAHIPVILLAGAFEPFDEEYAKAVGADDYIIKPFESQELISKVKSSLINADASRPSAGFAADAPQEETVSMEEYGEAAGEAHETAADRDMEMKWGEDIPAAQEPLDESQADNQEMGDDEYEAKLALSAKGFAEELTDALKEEKAPEALSSMRELAVSLKMPTGEEVSEMIRRSVDEKVSALVNSEVAPHLSSAIKDAVGRTLSEIAPGIVEGVTREAVSELLGSLRGEISAAIGRIVPEVAETIIKKEIEKITAEL
ncbi:MAG TPA: response regulator [Dissulfurispiraceae bacterium]